MADISASPTDKKRAAPTLVMVLLAFLTGLASRSLILYGFDLYAWGLSFLFLNCVLIFWIIFLTAGFGPVDYILKKYHVRSRYRYFTSFMVGLILGVSLGMVQLHEGLNLVFRSNLPAGIKVTYFRDYDIVAGGSNRSIYAEFQADNKTFYEWVEREKFKEIPNWEAIGYKKDDWDYMNAVEKTEMLGRNLNGMMNLYYVDRPTPQNLLQLKIYSGIWWDPLTGHGFTTYYRGENFNDPKNPDK